MIARQPPDEHRSGAHRGNRGPGLAPDRPGHPGLFWLGVVLIAVAVCLHVADWARTGGMGADHAEPSLMASAGIALDLLGLAVATGSLLPRGWWTRPNNRPAAAGRFSTGSVTVPARQVALANMDSVGMTRSHWRVMGRLFLGLVIDTMKPATIGFMLPGLRAEYGLTPAQAALLPMAALAGTTLGSLAFGFLGDLLGRRNSFTLTALILAATALCGLMPAFAWQLVMCFVMGLAAGGELPLIYAMLAESMPARHRGWLTVVVGGLGGLAGFLAATGVDLLLEPTFGWRVLWLPNLPTALFMLVLIRWVPESPRFLLQRGYYREARAAMAQLGVRVGTALEQHVPHTDQAARPRFRDLFATSLRKMTATLCLYGFAWSLCNWGFITWLPTMLRQQGQDPAAATRLLATSALYAIPGTLVAAALYASWSSKRTAILSALMTSGMLLLLWFVQSVAADRIDLMQVGVVGVLIASSSMIGVLAPYSVEVYPTVLRSTGSGLVAASSKVGGLIGPGLVGMLLAVSTGMALPALVVSIPIAAAGLLMLGAVETRGRRLEELTPIAAPAAARAA